jgi:hypothetical protein
VVQWRANILFEILRCDRDVDGIGDVEWLPGFRGDKLLVLGRGRCRGKGVWRSWSGQRIGSCLGRLRSQCLRLWESFLAKILDDFECGLSVNLLQICYRGRIDLSCANLFDVLLEIANTTLPTVEFDEHIDGTRFQLDIRVLQA